MHTTKIKITMNLLRKSYIIKNNVNNCFLNFFYNYNTTLDAIDIVTNEMSKYEKEKHRIHFLIGKNDNKMSYLSKTDNNKNSEYAEINKKDLDTNIVDLLSKNKDKQILDIIKICCDHTKIISQNTMHTLFKSYGIAGKPDIIIVLQKYYSMVNYNDYQSNGEFLHHLAKAHCYKGNSEKGLSILVSCYEKYIYLRGTYRVIFRELIQDTVMNRSEASLIIFKKYVLIFSDKWNDNYPLVCYWYMCWSSNWFSDQVLADELFETSTKLQEIVKNKATIFCINILRVYNDDAVMRLLQILLKYKMMSEYAEVLQVLFNYKLQNRDLRGCMEIFRNCETLGITLPIDQQGRYLRMLLSNDIVERTKHATAKPVLKNFKLKF